MLSRDNFAKMLSTPPQQDKTVRRMHLFLNGFSRQVVRTKLDYISLGNRSQGEIAQYVYQIPSEVLEWYEIEKVFYSERGGAGIIVVKSTKLRQQMEANGEGGAHRSLYFMTLWCDENATVEYSDQLPITVNMIQNEHGRVGYVIMWHSEHHHLIVAE